MLQNDLLAAATGLAVLGAIMALLLVRRRERSVRLGPWLRSIGRRVTAPIYIEFVVFVSAMVVVSQHFLPLLAIQVELWVLATLLLFGGDAATSIWLDRIDPEAAAQTPWLMGASRGAVQILLARGALFAAVGAATLFVFAVDQFHGTAVVFETVLYVPVILAAGALAATLINLRAIYRRWWARGQDRRLS